MRAHFRPLMVALLLTALIDNACDLGPFAPPSRATRATCSPLALPSLSAAPSSAAGTLRFSGIVRNAETCAAVGGVRVAAYEAHSTALTISSREFARTDASGLFVLSVPAGLYRLL